MIQLDSPFRQLSEAVVTSVFDTIGVTRFRLVTVRVYHIHHILFGDYLSLNTYGFVFTPEVRIGNDLPRESWNLDSRKEIVNIYSCE